MDIELEAVESLGHAGSTADQKSGPEAVVEAVLEVGPEAVGPEVELEEEQSSAKSPATYTAQTITCGGWSLALNINWSKTIIDTFELVNIPRAPNWLIGAVNVDGTIIPVVDLSVYFVPNAPPMKIDRHHRLLVGGKLVDSSEASSTSSTEQVFAILFTGLPMQIQYTRQAIDEGIFIPDRLREMCIGIAKDDMGKTYFEIDSDKSLEFLSLSLI